MSGTDALQDHLNARPRLSSLWWLRSPEAILFNVGANTSHGLRRTNGDKRRAIERLLVDEEWRGWSDSENERLCQADHKTFARMRVDLGISKDGTPRTFERGGTVAGMDTARIGRKPAEPSPTERLMAEPPPVLSRRR